MPPKRREVWRSKWCVLAVPLAPKLPNLQRELACFDVGWEGSAEGVSQSKTEASPKFPTIWRIAR